MPRILKVLERVESARMCLITEPPWLPVAPKTVISLDMMEILNDRFRKDGYEGGNNDARGAALFDALEVKAVYMALYAIVGPSPPLVLTELKHGFAVRQCDVYGVGAEALHIADPKLVTCIPCCTSLFFVFLLRVSHC